MADLTDDSGVPLTDESGTILIDVPFVPPPTPQPQFPSLIPGSLAWMTRTMASVNPVYSASIQLSNFEGLVACDQPFVNHLLTTNSGIILTNKTPTSTVKNKLVRWM